MTAPQLPSPIAVRCSRLPLLFSCSQSAAPALAIDSPDTDAADLGTGIHELLSRWIKRGRQDDDVTEVAARLRLDREELAKQGGFAWSAWLQAARYFPGPVVDDRQLSHEADGVRLTGTPDLFCPPASCNAMELRIPDFKTGWGRGDPVQQFLGYAFLLAQDYPKVERVYVCEIRTREGAIDNPRWYTRAELTEWWRGLVARVKDQAYRPGRHCGLCPRGATCEAKTALLRQCVEALTARRLDGVLPVPREALYLYDAAKLVEKAIGSALELVRALIDAGGPVEDEGRQLALVQQNRQSISFPAALPVLTEELGQDELAEILHVSKSDVERVVREKASRGGKSAAVKRLLEQLDAAGAIEVNTIERLEVRNVTHAIEVKA